MSDFKTTCPGCGSTTSAVGRAFADGDPCPFCGLSSDAAAEVIGIRATRADAALKARCEELVVRLDRAEAERDALRQRLEAVDDAMEGWKP